jgi:hypothetical protein
MEEIWKDIKGYEGLYQVSTLGRVRSVSREVIDSIGRHSIKEGRILSLRNSTQTGYPTTNLTKDGKCASFNVHRLVAEAFIPNPNNLPCVNHKDESRNNNIVSNLEWCSYRYNNTYGTAVKRRNESLVRFYEKHNELLSPVVQYSKSGEIICEYRSIREAEKIIGLEKSSGISACCHGKLKIAYGFVWRFKGEPFSIEEYKPKRHQKFVIKRDANGEEIARYTSMSAAATANGFDRKLLRKTNSINGYTYDVEKKENEYIPKGHKGPRPDLIDKGTKKVYQYTKDGKFVAEYNSIKEAAIAMGGIKRSSDIINCAKGNLRSAFGFDWRYNKKKK